MGFKRKHSRVDLSRSGILRRGSLSAACNVLDISESGLRIESRLFVKVADTLQLVMDLDGGKTLSCTIQPIYVRSPRFGARILSMSPEDQDRLAAILDDRVQRMFFSR